MKEDITAMVQRIQSVMKDDEYIPYRFSAMNALTFICGHFIIGSKRVWIKASAAAVQGLLVYKMNGEMAKFMDAMLNGKQTYNHQTRCMCGGAAFGSCHPSR